MLRIRVRYSYGTCEITLTPPKLPELRIALPGKQIKFTILGLLVKIQIIGSGHQLFNFPARSQHVNTLTQRFTIYHVKNILVKEGDYVTIGQPLVSVTQNRRLFLRAEVSEKYYPYLRTIGSANFKTPYDNKVYELKDLNGRLLSFGKSAGDNSFYVPVTFEFDNKGDIIPGSFVEAYLLSTRMENVISLPRTALTEEQGLFFVYLQLDEEGYKKQEVTLGADNGKSVQILTGVKAGDAVVTDGAYQVKLASASNAIPAHSHEH